MQSRIGEVIKPEGWMAWEVGGVAAVADNVVYAEYDNRGPGADTAGRLKWKGVKTITEEEALQFSAGSFVNGDVWVQPTGVPYTPGLLPDEGRA
ncbi:hypothetical protein HPP92_011105 [Vanilla planifolia]|nr:hypothetical protein HPP92_011105 [Vanilla planifolia]